MTYTQSELIIEPVTLTGEYLRLEPLSMNHYEGLARIGLDPRIWTWVPKPITTPEAMRAYIDHALQQQAVGQALPFAVIEKQTGIVIGSSRFYNIDRENRGMELGCTWLGIPWQGSFLNTERFLLLMQHAFETLGCIRVQFKADSLNKASRGSLIRMGAKEEGVLRNHMILPDGRIRHSCITASSTVNGLR